MLHSRGVNHEFGVRFLNVVSSSCDHGVLFDGVGVLGVIPGTNKISKYDYHYISILFYLT